MRVKGTVLLARLGFAKELGPDVLPRVLAEVSPATREMIEENPLPSEWYPFEAVCEVTEAIDRVAGKGDLALAEDMGRFACDANMNRFLRAFLRFGSVEFFLHRAAAAWRAHYDASTMEVVETGKHRVSLRIVGVPRPNHSHCLSVTGFVKRAAQLSGAKHVTGCVTACRLEGAAVCELAGEWD